MENTALMERRLQFLAGYQHTVNERLRSVENSLFFRILRGTGNSVREGIAKVGQRLLHSPLHPLFLKISHRNTIDKQYSLWVEREAASRPAWDWFQARMTGFPRHPLISIVMPVRDPQQQWLESAVESVTAQIYPHWQLCICDDASQSICIREFLAGKAKEDARIRFVRSEVNLGISGALNRAAELAHGDYLGFLDHDDVLSPYALFYTAEVLQQSDCDLIYSDEDRLLKDGRRSKPIFRPGWSPDLLDCCMYMGHLLVVRKESWERLGRFRSAFDGAQDYDLALRIRDSGGSVWHIPKVLYHWRMHEDSTSANPTSKPYTHDAGKRALQDSVVRRGVQAVVEDGGTNRYHLRRHIHAPLLVSIIICSRNPKLLRRCLHGIAKNTEYRHYEIVVVQHKTADNDRMDTLPATVAHKRIRYVGPFNFSKMNNTGAAEAGGDMLIFLNDDVVPLTPNWLRYLVAQVQRPEIGVVGAKLLYPSGAVQHAGIAVGIMDGVGHPFRHTFGSPYWHWLDCTRNVSAVTGACLGIRKPLFQDLGGFDPVFPINYNDLDFCLRARAAGYEVIDEPAAILRHDECRTRTPGIGLEERQLFWERWTEWLKRDDPFYNPNLTRTREDAGLRMD